MQKIINAGRKEIAENIVCNYLKNKNYIIVEKNFECKKEIIDLIAYDEQTKELVFISLKLCFLSNQLNKEEIIENQEILKNIAKYYNYEYGLYDIPVRFDMIKLFLNNSVYRLKHIKRVFY